MEYFLTEQQQMLKELSHKIAEEKVRPVAAEYDKGDKFPWDIVKIFADTDKDSAPLVPMVLYIIQPIPCTIFCIIPK